MTKLVTTTSKLDKLEAQIAQALEDWHERECKSFDEAVQETDDASDAWSIWDDMPTIDSKRAVGALVEFEGVLGEKLPISMIRPGGYASIDDLRDDLMAKMRERCADTAAAAA